MPTSPPIEDTPFSIAPFDARLHVAPLELFDRLRSDSPPLLVDLRTAPSATTLRGAVSWHVAPRTTAGRSSLNPPRGAWRFGDVEAILIDDDGHDATATARRLHASGLPAVRALYGGLRLYAFTLHPAVVQGDRFLRETEAP